MAAKGDLQICILASGSKGNAIHVSDGETSILIDAGLSGKEIERRLRSRGLRPEDLTALVVSHEHGDHTRGIGVLSRRYNLPVYISPATHRAAAAHLRKLPAPVPFEPGRPFIINRLTIHPFATSHDAEDPAGFTVSTDGLKVGIATDLGIATAMVKTHLQGCALLILEANHDPEMLLSGPYPWPLKQRVRGRTGHLSNPASRDLLGDLLHERLSHVILAHLSEQNNTPEKALREVGPVLQNSRAMLTVAAQHTCGRVFRVE